MWLFNSHKKSFVSLAKIWILSVRHCKFICLHYLKVGAKGEDCHWHWGCDLVVVPNHRSGKRKVAVTMIDSSFLLYPVVLMIPSKKIFIGARAYLSSEFVEKYLWIAKSSLLPEPKSTDVKYNTKLEFWKGLTENSWANKSLTFLLYKKGVLCISQERSRQTYLGIIHMLQSCILSCSKKVTKRHFCTSWACVTVRRKILTVWYSQSILKFLCQIAYSRDCWKQLWSSANRKDWG